LTETQRCEVRCGHIRGRDVVPGWGCCSCHAYNGYQRTQCRNCGHLPCYPTEGREGRDASELRPIGHDPEAVGEWLRDHPDSMSSGATGPRGRIVYN
jgi:hypothetical protein